MKAIVIELLLTLAIAFWVLHRLSHDAMNFVDAGWHSTVVTPGFQKAKIVGLAIVGLFFLWRIIDLIRRLVGEK